MLARHTNIATPPHRNACHLALPHSVCHLALAHMSVFLAQQLLGFRLFEESAFWASMFCDGNERGFNLFAHVNWWAKSVPAIPFSQSCCGYKIGSWISAEDT